MLRCPGVISWLFILRQNMLIFLMVIFDFMTHSMKINLIWFKKHNKNDQIKVSLSVFMCPGVSWGILGCPGVIRLTPTFRTQRDAGYQTNVHRPVVVKWAVICWKGGWKLSTIFLSYKVLHDWSIIKLRKYIVFIRRVYLCWGVSQNVPSQNDP